MLENSRKRARKSKLEVREGVELEETTVLYMEPAFEIKVKDEPMIDDPIATKDTNDPTEDPFNDIAIPAVNPKPLMEFSVKIEVEEFDETTTTETDISENQTQNGNLNNSILRNMLADEDSAIGNTVSNTKAVANINKRKINADEKIETQIVEKDDSSQNVFKEYVTNKPMMIRISDRLLKSENIAEQLLAIRVRNYAGRILDELVKEPRDMLLNRYLQDWQSWHLENSAVRDAPLIYKCYICGKSWWYLHGFKEHISKHMGNSKFEVSLEENGDECSLVCFQLDIVYNDVELPKTNCDRCGKSADSHAFIENEPYKCSGCRTIFPTCTQLYLHENLCPRYKKKNHLDESQTHKCSVCEIKCHSKTDLSKHMFQKHAVRSDVVTTWDAKQCNICGRSYVLLALHVCVKRTNNYGCNFCGGSFQKKVYKEIHVANYNESGECRICEKPLKAKCMEYSHMLQHTDRFAMMYKCIQCIEGRYYPNEYSIMHHTKVVHNRQFERKFKYLEMVILPKQCLEVSSKTPQLGNNSAKSNVPRTSENDIAEDDAPKFNVFMPSTQYRNTRKRYEKPVDVVVKQEPLEEPMDESLRAPDVSSIKTEVDETTPNIKITAISSLQDSIKLKNEPLEEVVAEDLVIIDDSPEIVSLYSSDNSENDFKLKYTNYRKQKMRRYACVCGYIDIASRLKAHKQCCTLTLAKRNSKKKSNLSSITDNLIMVKRKGKSAFVLGTADDDQLEDMEDDEGNNSDEDWGQGVPLENASSKSGLKYTCHCKKVFVGTLAAFRRHKQACVVVAKLKKEKITMKKQVVTFPCTKCCNEFNSIQRYVMHFNKIHYLKKYMCPKCLVVYPSLSRLAAHLTTHVNRSYLKIRLINEAHEWTKCSKCKICKEPVDKEDYFKHWELHLELNLEDADKERDSDSLPEEDGLVIDTGTVVATVGNEAHSVYSPEVMQRALEWLQSPDGLESVDAKTCIFCARRFSRQNDSKRHVIEHLLQDAYAQRVYYKALRCPICAQGFPKDDRFKFHMREHASLPVYQCNLCGKSFSDSSNFCKHKKVHDLSLIRCAVCDKKFHNLNHLARHMEMHEKTKPIICELCEKISFTQSAHKKHVRYAHERHKTRVLCPICRASFTRLKDKWDHMWLAHKERKFEADCPLCLQAFRRFADVKSHVRVAHSRSVRLSADGRMVIYA